MCIRNGGLVLRDNNDKGSNLVALPDVFGACTNNLGAPQGEPGKQHPKDQKEVWKSSQDCEKEIGDARILSIDKFVDFDAGNEDHRHVLLHCRPLTVVFRGWGSEEA